MQHQGVLASSKRCSTEIDPTLLQVRKWVQDCCGLMQQDTTFQEYLQDGTVLCKLIETIQPGLIKRVNYAKSPFAWRENCAFFLDACKKLGLKGAQLCKPEDIIGSNSGTSESQKHFRNVAVTLYWLEKTVKTFPWYTGPTIQSVGDEVNLETQNFRSTNLKEEIVLQYSNDLSESCSEANKPLHSTSTTPKVQSVTTALCEATVPKTQPFESSKPLNSLLVTPKIFQLDSSSPEKCTESVTLNSDLVSQKILSSECVSLSTICCDSVVEKSEPGSLPTQNFETPTPKEKHQHKTTVLIKVKKGQNQNSVDLKPIVGTEVLVDSPLFKKELNSAEEASADKPNKQLITQPNSVHEIDEKIKSCLLEQNNKTDILVHPTRQSSLTKDISEISNQSLSGYNLLADLEPNNTDNFELPVNSLVAQLNVPKDSYKQLNFDSAISLASENMQNIDETYLNPPSASDLSLADAKSKFAPQLLVQGGQDNAISTISMDIEIFLVPGDKHLGITLVPGASGMHSQVESIAQGSPASCSLLKVGDEIVSVNGTPVFLGEETTERIKKAAAERKVLIGIKRLQPILNSPPLKLIAENGSISATKLQALDLSRVRSDALPQGMLPKMVHCSTSKTQSNASLNSSDHILAPFNIVSEVGSADHSEKSVTDMHSSNPSVFGSTDSYLGNLDAVTGPMIARADTPLLDGIMEIVRKNSSLSAVVDQSSAQTLLSVPADFKPEGENVIKDTACLPNGTESVDDVSDKDISQSDLQLSTPLKYRKEYRDSASPQVQSSSASPMHNRGIEDLITSLRKLNEKIGTHDEEDEFKLLEEMLQSSSFKKAKEFHDRMLEIISDQSSPVVQRVLPVLQTIRRQLLYTADQGDMLINELRTYLRNVHFQGVLFCHDKVSTKDFYIPGAYFPRSAQDPVDIIHSNSDYNIMDSTVAQVDAPLSRDIPSGRKENSVIIFVQRTSRPLGITVYKQDNAVYIGQLLDADRTENLVEGDELLEINGVSVINKTHTDIMKLLSCQPGESLALTIIPVHDDAADMTSDVRHVRAHFSYEAALDDELPCKPLGLSFQRGEILEISNQDDPNWWQARRIFEDGGESLPGLIPARHLMQKREARRIKHHFSSAAEGKKGLMSVFTKRKKKKFFYQQGSKNDYSSIGDEVVTYEDVIKLSPDPGRKRPIVLVGAPGVGKKTLIQQLLNLEAGHFMECIQHTTRPIQAGEIEGKDYYFVSKEDMDREMHQDYFLECIEHGGFMYGIANSTVKKIKESNHVPILKLHPQTLKKIRNSGLMPYIIFICSPSLERLEVSRKTASERNRRLMSPSGTEELHSFTNGKLQSILEISCTIEHQYGHYFDWTIVNDNLQVATDMLREVTKRIEETVQWVPATWMQDC